MDCCLPWLISWHLEKLRCRTEFGIISSDEHNNQLGKSECSWKQSGRGGKNLMFLPTLSELTQPNPYQRSRISPDMIWFFVAHLFILCF